MLPTSSSAYSPMVHLDFSKSRRIFNPRSGSFRIGANPAPLAFQSLRAIDLRPVIELHPRLFQSRPGMTHVALLTIEPLEPGLLAGDFFGQRDRLEQAYFRSAAQVEHFAFAGICARGDDAVDDIVAKGKIARLLTVVEQRHFLAAPQGAHEQMEKHVRALSRSVNRKEPRQNRRHRKSLPVQMT